MSDEHRSYDALVALHQKLLAAGVEHRFREHPVAAEANRHFGQDPVMQAVKETVLEATGTHQIFGNGFSVLCKKDSGWRYEIMSAKSKDVLYKHSVGGAVKAVLLARAAYELSQLPTGQARKAGRSSKSAPKGSARGSGAPRRRRSAGRAP